MKNNNKTRNPENYTPEKYIKLAKTVFGGEIVLDPASCDEANLIVGAKKYYTIADDGLTKDWIAKTFWMNPPYHPFIKLFIDKFLRSWTDDLICEAILLVNASTETKWCQKLLKCCDAMSLTDHRIHYLSPGRIAQNPTQGSIFFYFGPNADSFCSEFSKIGTVFKQ